MAAEPHAPPRGFGLDLLRAAAILLVLVAHFTGFYAAWTGRPAPWGLAIGGFLGVDLFFVLSGFLIGRILLRAADQRAPGTWRRFLARRWMRTLPLYFLWLAVLAVTAPPHPPARLALFATFTQNLAWPVPDEWFGVSWSLSVEEWFYLLFSAAVLGIGRGAKQDRAFATALAVMLALPPVARAATPLFSEPARHQVVLFLDQIGIGVAAAWVAMRRPALFRAARAACLPGLALVALFLALPRLAPGWRGALHHALVFDLLAAGLALCLPAASAWATAPRAASVPVRAISLRAYGLYITHMSALEWVGSVRGAWHLGPAASLLAASLLAWALADLSWRWLERPILARRPPD